MRDRPDATGFTLLETVVALVLLGFAVTSAARLMVGSVQVLERSVHQDQALALGMTVLEVLQGLPAAHPWLASPPQGTGIRRGRWSAGWEASPLPGVEFILLEVRVWEASRPGPPRPLARLQAVRPAW